MRAEPLTSRPIQGVNKHFFRVSDTPVRYQDLIDPGIFKPFPGKKIIRNHSLNQGISIVGSGFLPVSHEEAFNLGVAVFELLFGITPQIHKERLSPTTTDYSVDLVSDECRILFSRQGYRYVGPGQRSEEGNSQMLDGRNDHESLRPSKISIGSGHHIVENYHDEYHPFIRVSNYLREGMPLSIELGYYRQRCTNGMMFDAMSRMTFTHPYEVADFQVIKGAALDHFSRYKRDFMTMAEKLWKLLLIHIPKAQIRYVAFDIFEKQIIQKSPAERRKLQAALSDLVDRYVAEIGENLNAALNVATEFSKLLEGKEVSQSTIQTLAATWADRVTSKAFDVHSYLTQISDIEERVMGA